MESLPVKKKVLILLPREEFFAEAVISNIDEKIQNLKKQKVSRLSFRKKVVRYKVCLRGPPI